jgi:hypothetical protein
MRIPLLSKSPRNAPDADAHRERLPNRRPAVTQSLEVGNHSFVATIGFSPVDGRPQEVFLSGAKDGTDLAAILDDASVVISIALQHGVSPAALAKSVARLPTGPVGPSDLDQPSRETQPASVIGAALDLLRTWEANG